MSRAETTLECIERNLVLILRKPIRQGLVGNHLRAEPAGYEARQEFDPHAARAGTDDPLVQIQCLNEETCLLGGINF